MRVTIDQLIKSTHFLLIWDTWEVERLAQLYVKEDNLIVWHFNKHIVKRKIKNFKPILSKYLKKPLGPIKFHPLLTS